MPRYGMLIDTNKCVGCFACRVACQMQNSLTPENSFIRYDEKETGKYPNVKWKVYPIQCHHCETAPCAPVCPTKARQIRPDGVVVVNSKKCIGCKYCVAVCPYQANTVNSKTGEVDKCRFCIELVEQGGTPACVSTCLTHARIFGDLDDPNSKITKAIAAKKPKALASNLGTKPKIYYVE